LPSLMKDIERKLQAVQEALDSLPQSFADNPQGKLLNICAEFNTCIKEYTIGSESHPDFFQDLYDEFEKLAKEITSTRPNFDIPRKTAQKGASAIAAPENVAPSASLPYDFTSDSDSDSESEANNEQHSQGRLFFNEVTNSSHYPSICKGHN
jgi:hypothetical protein